MGKDLSDHRGFFDGGDNFHITPTVRTVFDVDIEHPLKQSGPADAGSRWWARRLIGLICHMIGVDDFVWDDFGTVFGVGRQYAMEANQVESGARDQSGQSLHEFKRRHGDVGGPVSIRALERQHDIACAVTFESFIGNGRARNVAAQAFKLVTLIGGAAHVGMQAKAVFADTTLGDHLGFLRGDGFQAQYFLACPGSECNTVSAGR